MSIDEHEDPRPLEDAECPECGANYETTFTDGSYQIEGWTKKEEWPDQEICDFCNGDTICDGHIRYLHGQLDQHGRERTETIECDKRAWIWDKEGNGYYCIECWTIMCDGNPMEYEEFIHRRT